MHLHHVFVQAYYLFFINFYTAKFSFEKTHCLNYIYFDVVSYMTLQIITWKFHITWDCVCVIFWKKAYAWITQFRHLTNTIWKETIDWLKYLSIRPRDYMQAARKLSLNVKSIICLWKFTSLVYDKGILLVDIEAIAENLVSHSDSAFLYNQLRWEIIKLIKWLRHLVLLDSNLMLKLILPKLTRVI